MSEIHRTLRRGNRGSDVRLLQQLLTDLGFYTGPIDGIFGSATQEAVRAFQASRNLGVDGIVGPRTREALLAVVLPEEIIASNWVWLELEPSPDATQANGVAIVNADLRQLHVHARGLPDPGTFGTQFTTYRAWLLDANNQVVTTLRLNHCPTTDIWVGSGGTVLNDNGMPASVIVTPEANGVAVPTGVEVLGAELTEGIPVWPIGLDNTEYAPDGTGFAFINQAQGLLAVFASGLPQPKELGTDPAVQIAFNAYTVVFSHKHTGESLVAGALIACMPGIWVGIFRLDPLQVTHIEVIATVRTQPLPLEPVVVLFAPIAKPVKPIPARPLG